MYFRNSTAFFEAIRRGVDLYQHDRDSFRGAQKRAMAADFSWKNSAGAYMDLYRQTLKKARA